MAESSFNQIMTLVDQRLDAVTRAIALEALTRLIQRSPVLTGLFRNSWQVGLDTINTATGSPDINGSGALTGGAAALSNAKSGQSIAITNSLPYAEALESGHSKKAPNGMVAITAAEIQQLTDQQVSIVRRTV